MTRFRTLLTAGAAASLLIVASPVVSAHGHGPFWGHRFDTVSEVTPSTLTVKHPSGLVQELPMNQVRVEAAIYPANSGILRPGQEVSLLEEPNQRPIVMVHPVAYGTLTKVNTGWTVVSRRGGSATLVGANPQLLSMTHWSAGNRVMVFGARVHAHQVAMSAIAAMPLMARSVVQSVSPEFLTLETDQYGVLRYPLADVPGSLRQQLAALTPGRRVIAGLNPLNHAVLMVWPDHTERWARTLERGSAGQIVAISPKDLTLTNRLGTVTVPLDHPAAVHWPGHEKASISQLKPGMRLIVVREKDGHLKILVLAQP
jgi:hypothetical protein